MTQYKYIDGRTGGAIEEPAHSWQPIGCPEVELEGDAGGKWLTLRLRFEDEPETVGRRLRAEAIRNHLGPHILGALRYLLGEEGS